MVRKLAVIAVLTAALISLVPVTASALGLGSIQMRSALNQPLEAEIDLLRVGAGDLQDMSVALASPDTFARAGIERPAYLNLLKFKVISPPDSGSYIQITSEDEITEPFLNFLIEVNWANGRLLREFTVLVDPPVLSDRRPATVVPPVSVPITERRPGSFAFRERDTFQDDSFDSSFGAASDSEPLLASGGIDYGPVQRGDTLSEIAQQMRPNEVSLSQMMLALLDANPEAFFGNNINNLKMGFVLRLDDVNQALSIDSGEAARITQLQWEEWKLQRGIVGSSPSRFGQSIDGSQEARLRLVTPDGDFASSDSGSPLPTSVNRNDVNQVSQALTLSQEELDASRQESGELKGRLGSLEQQMANLQRLILLKDEQLLALQTQLRDAGEEIEPLPTDPLLTQDLTIDEELRAIDANVSDIDSLAALDQSDILPGDDGNSPFSDDQRPTQGLLAGLMEDPKVVGLVVILGLFVFIIGWLFFRRRKMNEFQESILTGQSSLSEAVAEQQTGEDASFMSDFAVSTMDGIQTEVSEVDPISEADVYLAYGRFKQAEGLISEAIEQNPDRPELKFKLLEIHHAAKDKEAFELQAEMFRDSLGGESSELWAKAVEMGKELNPDSALFSSQPDSGADSGAGGDKNVELDPASESAAALEDTLLADNNIDGELDISSTDDLDETMLNSDLSEELNEGQEDNSIDFDLSSFEESTATEEDIEATSDLNLEEELAEIDESELESTIDASDNSLDYSLDTDDSTDQLSSGDDSTELDMSMEKQLSEMEFSEDDLDVDLDDSLFADIDEIGTKLDLAKAYIDMGDSEGARSILGEVLAEGDGDQKQEAEELVRQIG